MSGNIVVPSEESVTPPLSLNTLKKYAAEIFTPIQRGESVTTIWLPMLGRRVVNKFIIQYPQLFEAELGKDSSYLLIYIEPLELTEESAAGYIRLIIKSILEKYPGHDFGEFFSQIDEHDAASISYSHWIDELIILVKKIAAEENKQVILFLGEFDELEFASQVFYNNLKSIWSKANGSLQFIFLLLTDVCNPDSLKKFGELNELILQNVVYVPLLSSADIDFKIDYFSKQLSYSFSVEEKKMLVQICGGHPYLLKSCTRLIALMKETKSDDLEELKETLITHYEPRSACQKMFNLLSEKEKDFLGKVIEESYTNKLPAEAEILVKLGLIKQNESGFWEPFGELFKSVVEQNQGKSGPQNQSTSSLIEGLVFDEQSGAIYVGSTNVEEKFTRQEYEILRFFLKDPSKLRTREEIGEAMWGKESYDKYSDWAIDQIMSKIRKKLQILGANKVLATVRGRGYKLIIS